MLGCIKKLLGLHKKVVVSPLSETTRVYRILNGTSRIYWGPALLAIDAVYAVILSFRASSDWTAMDYEIVHCENTKETLYVKTEYMDHKLYASILWDKPSEPRKRMDGPNK